MTYAIHLSPRAMADVLVAVSWRKRQSTSAAARWHAGLLAAIRTLKSNPERCPLADEAADLGIDLRELPYNRRPNTYRILFTIEGQAVNILRVRHAAQDRLGPADI